MNSGNRVKRTAIDVAEQLSKVRFPSMMVFGGGGNSSPTDPFAAVGLESMMRISEKLANESKE